MRIYQMTATFGKLQHQTMTLKPGLNIIEAPNEWGKSTWCAFLAAMLYGLDTRAKTTKNALADKEHYAPWSGTPMSGRIDLNFEGRNITIERRTKGRVPLGDFFAFETETGLPIPQLTASNCGETMLGVEESVFRRAGFIRLSDLPVTKDDALRRRLNALVTTGDESGDGERLARSLKELKNKCRYNRTGLLPQAEGEREQLLDAMEELEGLNSQCQKASQRLGEVDSWQAQLQNHREHLRCAQAEADEQRVTQARQHYEQARGQLEKLEEICRKLPSEEEARRKLRQIGDFTDRWNAALMEEQMLPKQAQAPNPPAAFQDMDPQGAMDAAIEDGRAWQRLRTGNDLLWVLLAVTFFAAAGLSAMLRLVPIAGLLTAAGAAVLVLGWMRRRSRTRSLKALEEKYGDPDPNHWVRLAEHYRQAMADYQRACYLDRDQRGDLDSRLAELKKQHASLCGSQSIAEVTQVWQEVSRYWETLQLARREAEQARSHLEDVRAMAKPVEKPECGDALTYSEEDTARLLSDVEAERKTLQTRLGQLQGRMEALGDGESLKARYDQVSKRIERLEDIYQAVTIAQENLEAAALDLQRRFAPRITKRAQELMQQMTGGRYDRLTLGEDLALGAGAREEDTLHGVLWRSEGTVDQLYLALRLAVSDALSPDAPLVLDDALVRFDDQRLRAALKILQAEGAHRQVLLFTCQKREMQILSEL